MEFRVPRGRAVRLRSVARGAFVLKGNLTLQDGQVAVTSLQSRKVYDHIDMKIQDFAPGKPFSIDAVALIASQGGQRISLQGKVGPLSEVAANRTPFVGALSLKRVAIDGLRNFLNTPVPARTDGIVSGETDIKTENDKLTAVGSVKWRMCASMASMSATP
jgi:hypothetical protein